MKRATYDALPANIRAAVRQAAERWETPDGVPLVESLHEEGGEGR